MIFIKLTSDIKISLINLQNKFYPDQYLNSMNPASASLDFFLSHNAPAVRELDGCEPP
jgi:hypothetical protein